MDQRSAQTLTVHVGFAGAEGNWIWNRCGLKIALALYPAKNAHLAELDRRRNQAAKTTPLPGTSVDTVAKGSAKSRNDSAKAALREAEAVQRLIDDLQAERSEIGMTDVERDRSRALRRAGAAATDAQRQQIGLLVEAIDAEKTAHNHATEAVSFLKDAAYGAFRDLIPQIETGNKALDNLLNTLIEATAQALLLGKGPLFWFVWRNRHRASFGSIFSFADGGYTGDGTKYQAAGVVHKGEYVLCKKRTSRIGVPVLEAMNAGRLPG